MKSNNEINQELEVNQIILDRDFLRLLRVYIKSYWWIELSKFQDLEVDNFLEILMSINLKKSSRIDLSYLEIFENLGKLFSDQAFLRWFVEFSGNYNLDIEIEKAFSYIWDYLLSVYKNSNNCANRNLYLLYSISKKVNNILEKRWFTNPIFQLKEHWFPIISTLDVPLDYVSLDDQIDLYWNKNPDEIYIKVKDLNGKFFYQNRNWEMLKTIEKTLIDGENKILFHEFTINDNDWEKTMIFDKDFNKMNLFNLIEFVNIWNDSTIKYLEKVNIDLKKIELSQIFEIYNFNWIKFIKFASSSFKTYTETFIIRSDWLFLKDSEYEDEDEEEFRYIANLFDSENIVWLEFVPFSYFDINSLKDELEIDIFPTDWFIDMNSQVIYVRWEPLIEIEEIQFKDYFKINNRDDFILSKAQLWEELKEYIAFNTQDNLIELDWEEFDEDLSKIWWNPDTWFILWFFEEETFYYNWKLLEKILRNINDKWDLDIYLKYDWKLNEIEYRDLIDFFRKNDKSGDVLKCFNSQVSRIS